MVHALGEIRRVLVTDGILVDLRPILDQWPIEVASARGVQETGYFQDSPIGTADDEAANQSIALAATNGWFVREQEEFFPFYYSWDTPSEMEEWKETEWHDFLSFNEEARKVTRSAWALGDADSQVRVRVKMLITRWKVLKGA